MHTMSFEAQPDPCGGENTGLFHGVQDGRLGKTVEGAAGHRRSHRWIALSRWPCQSGTTFTGLPAAKASILAMVVSMIRRTASLVLYAL